jgi:ABC-type sulfate/molybdate transport systems ATPase subunit
VPPGFGLSLSFTLVYLTMLAGIPLAAPHELDIDCTAVNGSSLPARVLKVNPNGSVAKVRLESQESNLELNIEINLDRDAELAIEPGDLVHVAQRRFRVFIPEDYAI